MNTVRTRSGAVLGAALLAALLFLAAACSSTGTTSSPAAHPLSSGASAVAHAYAPVIQTCLPANELELAVSTAARTRFGDCLNVPGQNRPAFYQRILSIMVLYRSATRGKSKAQREIDRQDLITQVLPGVVTTFRKVPLPPSATQSPALVLPGTSA